ncbi:MAG: TonB family protein [Chitinispirillaceae bacterium]|nr:TonB family protein [Chitinispirillaceae bacterium]
MSFTRFYRIVSFCRYAGPVVLLAGTVSIAGNNESVRSGGSAVGFSAEPRLVTEGTVELPIERLLKRGIEGTVLVEVDLDQTGAVEHCTVRRGIDPALDSLVVASMHASRFSPTYEQGSAVSSTVSMRFSFDPREVARGCKAIPPTVYGTAFDAQTALPVQNAQVNLELSDTLADTGLTVPVGTYLDLIGEVPGQSARSGMLTTVTDSLGRFSFRLLPACPVRMAIIAAGFEVAHAGVSVIPGTSKKVTCRLEPIEKDSTIEIIVYGSPLRQGRVDIEEEQLATGLTHYLSDVLQTQVTIRAVPESRSRMMVRAGSPFDNRYYICGVPMLAPFHFGGHSYADIDGMMISALSEINLTIDRIAGRQIDASGFRIDAQPGIYRPANRELIKRPELSVDFNTIGQDFLLSLPKKKSDDCLQLGFTRAENTMLLFFNARRKFEENEFGSPVGYGNVTLTGAGKIGKVHLQSFSWLAWDTYLKTSGKETYPWGMAALTMDADEKGFPQLSVGGSRQYFASGKRFGGERFLVYSSYTNGSFSAAFDTLECGYFNVNVDVSTEMLDWEGSLQKNTQTLTDSTYNNHIGAMQYFWHDNELTTEYACSGREMILQAHGTVKKTLGEFTVALDLLGTGILYNTTPDAIGDAGLSLLWQGNHIDAGLNGGRVTSRPDIRGLPDSLFRRTHCSSYLFSAPVNVSFPPLVRFGIQPYFRKKKNEPEFDPVVQVWIPDASTGLLAAGADIDGELHPTDWLSVNGAVNVAKAYRVSGEVKAPYEWDIPWTGRGTVHLHFGEDAQMHFYLKGITAKGMLFYDVEKYGYIRAPDYLRLDLSIQYRSRFIDHRFLTRYDAYFNIFNLTDRYNATDYYWDHEMKIRAIPQGYMTIEMGVRLGFRA